MPVKDRGGIWTSAGRRYELEGWPHEEVKLCHDQAPVQLEC